MYSCGGSSIGRVGQSGGRSRRQEVKMGRGINFRITVDIR
jgi:hypothetical protein